MSGTYNRVGKPEGGGLGGGERRVARRGLHPLLRLFRVAMSPKAPAIGDQDINILPKTCIDGLRHVSLPLRSFSHPYSPSSVLHGPFVSVVSLHSWQNSF